MSFRGAIDRLGEDADTPSLLEQAKSGLQEAKPLMTGGLSSAEMDEAIQSILGVEKARRASTARLMTRAGARFDPRSFARATAPLAGGTQRAIGGLRAKSAGMARAGTADWLRLLMQLYSAKSGVDLQQQQLALSRQQLEQGETGVGDVLRGVGQFGLNVATLGMLGRD